tara:strand:- start:3141 stop:4154 length:1014 start_codon:yes stop_codon:yes gene_type:complete
MKLSKRYVIGTHVMWFEIEMYKDFLDGLENLLTNIDENSLYNVTVDICFNMSEVIEKIDTNKITAEQLEHKFNEMTQLFWMKLGARLKVNKQIIKKDECYFHTDYRRDLNYNYCKKVDYVMWGETDSFFPKEAFQVIETLAKYTDEQNIHRYLLSFADRKMWDASWDPLVHIDYRDVVFVDDDKQHLNPNQAKSPMSIEKMNEINGKTEEFQFGYIQYPKISGACLVLSADLIKSGVNIPSCMIYNDDEGLSIMSQKLLGQNYLQFVCENILHVHARRHPQKRMYVKDENNEHSFIDKKNNNFQEFLKLSKHNINILHTGKGKFKEYEDFKKVLESK